VTWAFLYLLIFLGGFTLALVTGLVRRVLHPTELCDFVVMPSHEHWHISHTPVMDLLVSFTTVFGFVTLVIHGILRMDPLHEIAIGAVAGLLGVLALRTWVGRICDPSRQVSQPAESATVVREIPANGFGQVEVLVGGTSFKLAAKSLNALTIPVGTAVMVLNRQESVVVVAPLAE
jgi:hypothetical protein